MNSIASMPSKKPPPSPTKESLVLKSAFDAAGLSQAAIARKLDVSPGLVWQWLNGNTAVPANKAVRLAEIVSADPRKISTAYADVHQHEPGNVVPIRAQPAGDDGRRPDLVIARLENDVTALNYALAALIATMTAHRPAEARDAASTIRKSVPAKFRDKGLLHELLQTMDRAGKS